MSVRLPSPWVVTVIAAFLGSLTGAGTVFLQATLTPMRAGLLINSEAGDSNSPRPQIEVPETLYKFGQVSVGGTDSHAFTLRNVGMAPLVVTKGSTSCTCTVSDFEGSSAGDGSSRTIPPGGTTTVRIEWKGKGSGGPFRQQATIFTNDPARPEIAFAIEGQVIPVWKAVPPSIGLTGLSAGEPAAAAFKLYTYANEPPKLTQVSITDEKLADAIRVTAEPLAAVARVEEPAATGGFAVSIDIASGLPLGKLRTDVELVFSFAGEDVLATVPLEGVVTGDLTLIGPTWDRRSKAVRLGTVSRRKGFSTKLFLTVKGASREQVRPVVKEVIPAGLRVDIGKPTSIGGGDLVRIGLTLSIDADSPQANNLCTNAASAGRIVLETGHPDSPELSIPVCVAIAE